MTTFLSLITLDNKETLKLLSQLERSKLNKFQKKSKYLKPFHK